MYNNIIYQLTLENEGDFPISVSGPIYLILD